MLTQELSMPATEVEHGSGSDSYCVPSLQFLCIVVMEKRLVIGDDPPPGVYDLPPDLFDDLVNYCSPLALHNLQSNMPVRNWDGYEDSDDNSYGGTKMGRRGGFQRAWRAFFMLRWTQRITQPNDWQRLYWEAHLQNCIDEATEVAMSPSFDQSIGDINVPDRILRYIIREEQMSRLAPELRQLSYHLGRFGSYLRSLKLLNVLCVAETSELLRASKLQSLVLQLIRADEHVKGIRKLLLQNRETLRSLNFIHCKISSGFFDAVWDSLQEKGSQTHWIEEFMIKSSRIKADTDVSHFRSFLQSARFLRSLKLSDTQLDRNFARTIFTTLLESCPYLSILDLSENNISGWLSGFNWRSAGKFLPSLTHLNLRGNELRKDDVENLTRALLLVPNLMMLDLTDNPIGDDGIESLTPFLAVASERYSPLANLSLKNCELSCDGAVKLLDTLSTLCRPLKSLCIADNQLGSRVSGALTSLMESPLERLDISGIGLGPDGFQELKRKLVNESKLVSIDISKNRGGIAAVNFLLKLVSCAPKLEIINAMDNLMPAEPLANLCIILMEAKGGHLEEVDLRGNYWNDQCRDLLAGHRHKGLPKLHLPFVNRTLNVPYDDDP